MTHLHQKLNQLTLTTMSRQLDQIASDAAAKNLSFSQALESLADLELESRNQNAIERRFRGLQHLLLAAIDGGEGDEKGSRRPNPIDVHVGSRVRFRRMLLGMSQEKLGEKLGLTFQQVQKYEKGINRIGAGRYDRLFRRRRRR